MLSVCHKLIAVAVLSTFFPALVAGQTVKAGVVTALEGTVTARRVAAPEPVALKFKDDVFLQDRIVTGERSLARVLLGGKAIVTVRERSVFAVSEVPGRSTVEIDSGKIGVAVARDRMRPGEQIEIRTPGAIVAVRGTVLVVDVPTAGAATPSGPPPPENVYVLRGTVEAQVKPAPGAAPAPPVTINPFQVLSVRGGVATVGSFTPQQVAGIVAGLRSSGMQFKDGANKDEAKAVVQETTAALVQALVASAPGGATAQPSATATESAAPQSEAAATTVVAPPLIPDFIADVSDGISISGDRFFAAGERLATFSGASSRTSAVPFASIVDAHLIQDGDESLIAVQAGADATLSGPLAVVQGSTVIAGGHFLDVEGKLKGAGSQPFLSFNPSVVFASESLFSVAAGGELTLAGQLLNDVGSTFITPADFATVLGRVTSTSTLPLLQFTGSSVIAGTAGQGTSFLDLFGPTARLTLAGPLMLATDTAFTVDGFGMLRVRNGAELITTTPAPLVTISGGFVDGMASDAPFSFNNSTGNLGGGLLIVSGLSDAGGTGSPPAPFVSLVGSTLSTGNTLVDATTTGLDFTSLVALASGSTLTVGAGALLRLTNAHADTDELLAIDLTSHVVVGGPIAELASGSMLTSVFDLIPAKLGATITSTSTAPLIGLTSSTLAVGDAIFGLRGRPGQTTTEVADGVTLTVGTDTPISHGGPWVSASASTLTAKKALALDTALLAASAPLLNLRSGSAFTSAFDALDLTTTAKLTSVGPLVALDASTLAVNSGAMVSLNGTSLLRVTGDLFSLVNGSVLRTNNGPLIRVSGNSVLNVTGALAVFGGTGGNQLNVTNSLCGVSCPTFSGIPVHFINGASSTNVTIGPNPLRNTGLGSLVTSGINAAAILLDGPNSKVTLTAP